MKQFIKEDKKHTNIHLEETDKNCSNNFFPDNYNNLQT